MQCGVVLEYLHSVASDWFCHMWLIWYATEKCEFFCSSSQHSSFSHQQRLQYGTYNSCNLWFLSRCLGTCVKRHLAQLIFILILTKLRIQCAWHDYAWFVSSSSGNWGWVAIQMIHFVYQLDISQMWAITMLIFHRICASCVWYCLPEFCSLTSRVSRSALIVII